MKANVANRDLHKLAAKAVLFGLAILSMAQSSRAESTEKSFSYHVGGHAITDRSHSNYFINLEGELEFHDDITHCDDTFSWFHSWHVSSLNNRISSTTEIVGDGYSSKSEEIREFSGPNDAWMREPGEPPSGTLTTTFTDSRFDGGKVFTVTNLTEEFACADILHPIQGSYYDMIGNEFIMDDFASEQVISFTLPGKARVCVQPKIAVAGVIPEPREGTPLRVQYLPPRWVYNHSIFTISGGAQNTAISDMLKEYNVVTWTTDIIESDQCPST